MKFSGYRASRSTDGVLTIHQVPIFVECQRGDTKFDAAWINAAVLRAQQAEREGYLPPLHVRHHDGESDTNVRAAGFFRVIGVESITFKGQERIAVIADLMVTDPEVSEEVLSKRLPYRSVEIFNVEKPSIDSLALLDHEAPYLELPMLMVSDVKATGSSVASATFSNPWLQNTSTSPDAVVALFRRGSAANLLFEDTMTKTAKNEKFAADPTKEMPIKDYAAKTDQAPEAAMAEDTGMNCDAICAAIASGALSPEEIDKIMAAIEKVAGASPDASSPAPAAAPGGESMSREIMETMARLRGEVEATKALLASRDANDRRREDVAVALKKLDGRPLGSDLELKLQSFHASYGPKAFKAHVDAMLATFAALPSGSEDSAAMFAGQSQATSEKAMAYASQGADAIARANTFSREWDELHQRGAVRMSQDRYIALNMQRAGWTVKVADNATTNTQTYSN
jgi:hypothetical protein